MPPPPHSPHRLSAAPLYLSRQEYVVNGHTFGQGKQQTSPPPPSSCLLQVWVEEGLDERDQAREEAHRQEAAAVARRSREELSARRMQQRVEEEGVANATQAAVVEVRIDDDSLFPILNLCDAQQAPLYVCVVCAYCWVFFCYFFFRCCDLCRVHVRRKTIFLLCSSIQDAASGDCSCRGEARVQVLSLFSRP